MQLLVASDDAAAAVVVVDDDDGQSVGDEGFGCGAVANCECGCYD